jgi:hypothetical protein
MPFDESLLRDEYEGFDESLLRDEQPSVKSRPIVEPPIATISPYGVPQRAMPSFSWSKPAPEPQPTESNVNPLDWLSLSPEEQTRIIDQLNRAKTARLKREELKTSGAGTFGREALSEVGPAGAFALGFAGGFPMGAPLGGFPGLITGTAGGILASETARELQGLAAQAIAPEEASKFQDLIQAGREQHPYAAVGGRLAGALPTFQASIPKTLKEGLVRGAIGTGITAAPDVIQGKLPSAPALAEGFIGGAFLGDPRAKALRVPLIPHKPAAVPEGLDLTLKDIGVTPRPKAAPKVEPTTTAPVPRIEEVTLDQLLKKPTGREHEISYLQELEQRIQKASDFEKARAEEVKLTHEDAVKEITHPDKPLTENQLRIVEDSLKKAVLGNQGKGPRRGIISGSKLEKWADDVLGKDPRERVSLNPIDILAKDIPALAIKGAAILERGIIGFSDWSEVMIKNHGEAIRPLLNRAYNQAFKLKGGVESASSIREAAEVHGPVREQPVKGAQEMPAPASGEGVQSQAPERVQEVTQPVVDDLTKKGQIDAKEAQKEGPVPVAQEPGLAPDEAGPGLTLTPAVESEGRTFTGMNHADAIVYAAKNGVDALDAEHKFLGSDGKFYNRKEAGAIFEKQTGQKPKFEEGLHSTELEQAGLLKHVEGTKESTPAAVTPEGPVPATAEGRVSDELASNVSPGESAVGIAPAGTELVENLIDWTRNLPNKLAGHSAPVTSKASEESGNALVRFASAQIAAPLQPAHLKDNYVKLARKKLNDQLIKDGLAVKHTNGPAPRLGGKSTKHVEGLWVRSDIVPELQQALKGGGGIFDGALANIITLANKIQMAGPTDAVWHIANMVASIAGSQGGKNVLTDLARKMPGVNILDAIGRITASSIKVMSKSPEIMDQIRELAEIGALRGEHHSGKIGKLIGVIDQAGRLVRDDMYKNLVDRGLVTANEATRREWVNQLGQYNPRLTGKMQRFFKEAGFSPFIVAGRNFNRMAARRLTLSPGIKAASPAAAAEMRAIEALGTIATLVAIPSLINYFRTGSPNGRPGVKFGQIDTGNTDSEGKAIVIDPAQWTGHRRALRISGIGATIEGVRAGKSHAEIKQDVIKDILGGIIHPWAGPVVNAAEVARTGYSPTRFKESENPNDYGANALAALKQLNPVAESIFSSQEKKKPTEVGEFAGAATTEFLKSLGGAAGVKTVKIAPATQSINTKVRAWMEKSDNPKLVHEFEKKQKESFSDDYKDLRKALEADDPKKALEAYNELLKLKKPKDIIQTIRPFTLDRDYVRHDEPVTSLKRADENKFVDSLSPEDRKLYDAAKAERMETWRRFQKVLQARNK